LVADHEEVDNDDADFNGEEVRLRFHTSYEEALESGMAHAVPTLWGDATGAALRPLERCSRLLPHDQDTGGFFVALLRKKAVLPVAASAESAAASGARVGGGKRPTIGPTSVREIPAPAPEELLRPVPSSEVEAVSGAYSRKHRLQLLRADREGIARVVSPGIEAFQPGSLQLLSGGVPLNSLKTAGA